MRLDRSPEWLKQQIATIGSTAAGVIAGVSPYQTRRELYHTMVDAMEGRISPSMMNDDMRRGLLTEPLHRQLLEDELGKTVHDHNQDDFITEERYSWAHALPDGWLFGDEYPEIPVQLKCPRTASWHKIKLDGIHGHWVIGTQHTLAITGAPYEHFSVLNPETMRLIHFDVKRDDSIIASLMELEREFYAMVLERRAPTDDVPDVIAELPNIGGEMIRIETEQARDLADAYRSARQVRDEADLLMDETKSKIIKLMDGARIAQLPHLRCYQIPHAGSLTFDIDAAARDGVDVPKYKKRGKPYTTFRTYNVE